MRELTAVRIQNTYIARFSTPWNYTEECGAQEDRWSGFATTKNFLSGKKFKQLHRILIGWP